MKNSFGVVHLIPLLIVGALIIAGSAYFAPSIIKRKEQPPSVEIEPTVSLTPTATPTLTPTPSPTPTLTPTPTIAPTPTVAPPPTAVPVAAQSGPPGAGHSRYTIATQRGSFLIDVVSINMAGVRMITDTASDGECSDNCPTLSLGDYIARNGAFAGMNGTYFCPASYESCAGKKDTFDFPVWNSRLGRWINGGNLFWNNRSSFYQNGGSVGFNSSAASTGGVTAAIVNHPGLVDAGNVIADRFGEYAKQGTKGTKTGIGKNGNTVYLVVARNVDMMDLAHVFKSLGATHALNLDGGGSVALWYGGYKVGPGRSLPNAVVFAN